MSLRSKCHGAEVYKYYLGRFNAIGSGRAWQYRCKDCNQPTEVIEEEKEEA